VAGPAIFLLVCLVLALTGCGLAVGLRARSQGVRWAGWQQLAASRGLQAVEGDPLGLGPLLSGTTMRRSVQRTLSGTVDDIPVAVVLTVGLSNTPGRLQSRSDLYGVARVGQPVPVERIRAALSGEPGVSVGAVGDLVVLKPVRGLRMAVEHPPPEEAGRLFDLAARAARAARS